MEKYLPEGVDIISMDSEGFDLEILKTLDFAKYNPKIICVETLRCEHDSHLRKHTEIGEYLKQHGFEFYADTRVNSIFVLK